MRALESARNACDTTALLVSSCKQLLAYNIPYIYLVGLYKIVYIMRDEPS